MNKRTSMALAWITALVTLAIASWALVQTTSLKSKLAAAEARADSLATAKSEKGSVSSVPSRSTSSSTLTLLTNAEINRLVISGLRDPANDLRRDLVTHRELIPFRSTLGGTFQFYPEKAILLPGGWVCAYFEDGHGAGYLILRYEVMQGGKIGWKRVDGRLL